MPALVKSEREAHRAVDDVALERVFRIELVIPLADQRERRRRAGAERVAQSALCQYQTLRRGSNGRPVSEPGRRTSKRLRPQSTRSRTPWTAWLRYCESSNSEVGCQFHNHCRNCDSPAGSPATRLG